VAEVLEETRKVFKITKKTFYPLNFLPSVHCNLVVGLVLTKK